MSIEEIYVAIGGAIDTIQSFQELGLVAPYQDAYEPYSVIVEGGDLMVYGHGIAKTVWRWGFITQSARNLLKTYCPGKSAIVYVRIKDDDWEWVYCKAIMVWPKENPPITGIIVDFTPELRILQNYGESLP